MAKMAAAAQEGIVVLEILPQLGTEIGGCGGGAIVGVVIALRSNCRSLSSVAQASSGCVRTLHTQSLTRSVVEQEPYARTITGMCIVPRSAQGTLLTVACVREGPRRGRMRNEVM